MKPKIIVIIALICFLIFILPAADMGLEVTLKKLDSHNSIGKQWLIMIAVGHYREWPNLQNPVNDTKQIETVLKRKYYIDEIIKVYDQDATKRNITRLFLDLQDKAGIHDSILIYYAGHGYLDKNSNSGFWIPFDAGTDAIAQRNWLPNTQIRGYISQMKSMHICLIVDACFSGDILEISRGKPNLITNEYFRKAYKRTSRQVLTSGALEAVPDKSEFAFLLTQTLEKNTSPYIDPLMLFKEIRLGVRCTTPLLGNLKLTGHQDGASFLLFLKEPALQYVAHDHESSINTQKKIMSDDSNECTWENKEAPYNMIYVKGGKFKMGAQHGAIDEWPVHEVVINDFYIGRYEVTFHEYQNFCIAKGEKIPNDNDWGRDERPVIYVSWFEAVEYCNWLSLENKYQPCYIINGINVTCNFNANGYRLPTEAEWEYAARGGYRSKYFTYAGHNDVTVVGWYNQNSDRETHPAGTLWPNELGIYDLSGNVWEWCWDYYIHDYYKTSRLKNPVGPDRGKKRVLRGGSWYNGSNYLRTTVRGFANPKSKDDYFGFRVVRSVK